MEVVRVYLPAPGLCPSYRRRTATPLEGPENATVASAKQVTEPIRPSSRLRGCADQRLPNKATYESVAGLTT